MYKELFQLSKKQIEQQQKKGARSSRLQNYLMFGTCYKLVRFEMVLFSNSIQINASNLLQNTQEHLDFALQLWDNSVKEHQLTQSVNFLSMLAVNQEHAEIALDILPEHDKHFSSTFVRIIALANCGNFEEVSQTLKTLLQDKSHRISGDVVRKQL